MLYTPVQCNDITALNRELQRLATVIRNLAGIDSETDDTKVVIEIDRNNNVVISNAALATDATDGFLYIPSCAGAPTGTPTTKTGRIPIVYDTTNERLYAYNGGWVSVTLA